VCRERGEIPAFKGLYALESIVTVQLLRRMLSLACSFAAEWFELRAIYQNKLCGKVIR
jgi:hypothetical protein